MNTIAQPGSNLVLVRNAEDTAWILCRRLAAGQVRNLAAPQDSLDINAAAMLADGAGDPSAFLAAAIAADRNPI